MNIEIIKEFVELAKQKSACEATLAHIKESMKPLEELILTDFSREGVQNMKVDGRLVSVYTIAYAKKCEGVTAQQAVAALENAGMDEFINYNTLSLSGEMRKEEFKMPLELTGIIEMVPQYSIRSRKS